MAGLGASLLTAVSLVVSQTTTILSAAGSVPPKPDQATIVCHDAAWEQSNLEALEGLRMHKKLLPFVQQLQTDGHAAGVHININSAYRNCSEQGNLRAMACGIGDYNLYQKPINLCLPPTEPAGKSLHNEGLAVDLACYGYGMFEYSPCYSWFKQNASKYHLFEHELEPWHWSSTGK
jgi:LAS superfamily LD-carboxypeptidase LdcB